ncbi:hypothetical protein DAI22_01g033100 [Oryza sativa Japonica Group]|nr:hypothetical protein DAI22_01g033100 [Oryza sativa Japonica Group]
MKLTGRFNRRRFPPLLGSTNKFPRARLPQPPRENSSRSCVASPRASRHPHGKRDPLTPRSTAAASPAPSPTSNRELTCSCFSRHRK